jgi:hypothetical protein
VYSPAGIFCATLVAFALTGAAALGAGGGPEPRQPPVLSPGSLRYDGDREGKALRPPRRSDSTLARGGQSVLPEYRVVGFCGAPQAPGLGELGIGSPQSAAKRLRRQMRPYKDLSGKPLYPLFQLIGVVAQASPGPDGKYRGRQPNGVIRRYAQEAKKARALLMLDIQPGRSNFMEEVKYFKPWLRKPFVSVGLDPEWNMGPGGVPGQSIGHTSAGEINRITRYHNRSTRENHLPDKLVIVHQFTESMIRNKENLQERGRIDLVLNADGIGSPAQKSYQYGVLSPNRGSGFYPGFKLFYEEDPRLMSPLQVMRLRPRPSAIGYE